MESYREDYWKLAEIEDRFNKLQGVMRTLASTWTLAAFAGLAVLLQVAEKTSWLAPPALLAWLISVLAAIGLELLWLMDQFVYQRLLAAPFLSALFLEETHCDLPPTRALMLSGSSGGMSKYLRLYYFTPIALFCIFSIGAVAGDAVGAFPRATPIADAVRPALALGSVIVICALLVVYQLSARVGVRALATGLGVESAARAVENDRLLSSVQAAIQALEKTKLANAALSKDAAQPSAAADSPQAARR